MRRTLPNLVFIHVRKGTVCADKSSGPQLSANTDTPYGSNVSAVHSLDEYPQHLP